MCDPYVGQIDFFKVRGQRCITWPEHPSRSPICHGLMVIDRPTALRLDGSLPITQEFQFKKEMDKTCRAKLQYISSHALIFNLKLIKLIRFHVNPNLNQLLSCLLVLHRH